MAELVFEADPRLCGRMASTPTRASVCRDVPLEGDPRERLLLKKGQGPRPGDSWPEIADFLKRGLPGLKQDPLSQYIRFDSSFERLHQ